MGKKNKRRPVLDQPQHDPQQQLQQHHPRNKQQQRMMLSSYITNSNNNNPQKQRYHHHRHQQQHHAQQGGMLVQLRGNFNCLIAPCCPKYLTLWATFSCNDSSWEAFLLLPLQTLFSPSPLTLTFVTSLGANNLGSRQSTGEYDSAAPNIKTSEKHPILISSDDEDNTRENITHSSNPHKRPMWRTIQRKWTSSPHDRYGTNYTHQCRALKIFTRSLISTLLIYSLK